MNHYNYAQLKLDLSPLNNESLNKLDYLTKMHELLVEHSVNLARVVGKLKGEIIYLETAKGRKEANLEKEQVLKIFEEAEYAKKWLDVIDKVIFITGQKVKIIHETD